MASEQFSLSWDNFHKNMSSGMNSLLENEDLVDVTLAVEGKYLKAHKMVLSVCSPYFRELFKVNPCKHPIVFMKDVSYMAMSDLLQFMYQGEVQVSQEHLSSFIKTAEALQIKGLMGDGCSSTECDIGEEPKKVSVAPPKISQIRSRESEQIQQTPITKRPRFIPPVEETVNPVSAKLELSVTNNESIELKMEPYEEAHTSLSLTDDNADDTWNDDPLDSITAEDMNEYYGGYNETQAATSTDRISEGQVQLADMLTNEYTHDRRAKSTQQEEWSIDDITMDSSLENSKKNTPRKSCLIGFCNKNRTSSICFKCKKYVCGKCASKRISICKKCAL